MLYLARKIDEEIMIGDNITIKILALDEGIVVVGIKAPLTVPVHRREIQQRMNQNSIKNFTNIIYKKPRINLQ